MKDGDFVGETPVYDSSDSACSPPCCRFAFASSSILPELGSFEITNVSAGNGMKTRFSGADMTCLYNSRARLLSVHLCWRIKEIRVLGSQTLPYPLREAVNGRKA